jgi:hypothetical protein
MRIDLAFRDAEFRVRKHSAPAEGFMRHKRKAAARESDFLAARKIEAVVPAHRGEKVAAKRLLFGGIKSARQWPLANTLGLLRYGNRAAGGL